MPTLMKNLHFYNRHFAELELGSKSQFGPKLGSVQTQPLYLEHLMEIPPPHASLRTQDMSLDMGWGGKFGI